MYILFIIYRYILYQTCTAVVVFPVTSSDVQWRPVMSSDVQWCPLMSSGVQWCDQITALHSVNEVKSKPLMKFCELWGGNVVVVLIFRLCFPRCWLNITVYVKQWNTCFLDNNIKDHLTLDFFFVIVQQLKTTSLKFHLSGDVDGCCTFFYY